MNGVRRLLGGNTATSSPPSAQDALPPQTVPPAFTTKSGPSWPPSTPPLFHKKGGSSQPTTPPTRQSTGTSRINQPTYPSPSPTRSQTLPNSPASGSSSPQRPPASRFSTRKSVNLSEAGWKRNSGNLNTRDELLMSLMASEAVIDCRDFEILTAEDVEDLKKEHQVLSARLGAMSRKLALETKIRDAAVSLAKVNASHKAVSKQTTEQLDAANQRVETAQKELWKVSERHSDVHKKLMEHRAGVLSFSVRNMEKKLAPSHASGDSGYDSSNRSTLTSPAMSTITSASKSRFDGAHLFAGHAETIVPRLKLSAEAAAAEIVSLEEKLKTAKESLTAAGKKQAQMTRELSLMKLEKQEVETMMGMDLQAAEETIAALETEIPRLESLDQEVRQLRKEQDVWEREREELFERGEHANSLRARLADLEQKNGETAGGTEKLLASIRESSQQQLDEKDAEIQRLRDELEDERTAWQQERAYLEEEKLDDLSNMQIEMDQTRDNSDAMVEQLNEEINMGLTTMQALIKTHGMVLFSRDSSLQGLLNAIGMHVETLHNKLDSYTKAETEWENTRRKLEDDVRAGLDKREALTRELEEVRKEQDLARREAATKDLRTMGSTHLRTPSIPLPSFLPEEEGGDTDVGHVISILLPLWQILPSPEARAAKFSGTNRTFRTGSPTPSTPGPANGVATSLSDLDVRSLKALYDSRQPAAPGSPKLGGPFTIEAFAARVQALINDDKALIERLVRFAQAHDLLKRNAERAQKLAQDGNSALETYQKQVRILEERNMSGTARQAALQEEVQILHDAIERITAEKRELEMLAAEQAESCAQLTEANNALSAKTLTLAEEAAQAPEMVRRQLEAQLKECRKTLEAAQDEVDAMRSSEQSQRIALLDELNSMQTENGNLRAQLRAVKK